MKLGKNQQKMLDFAMRNKDWHTFARDVTTKRAARSLEKQGLIEVLWWPGVSGPQYRLKQPSNTDYLIASEIKITL